MGEIERLEGQFEQKSSMGGRGGQREGEGGSGDDKPNRMCVDCGSHR